MRERRGTYSVLAGRPVEKIPLRTPRHRWEDNIKKNLQEVGGGGRDRFDQTYDRYMWRALVNDVINLRVP
jgi:hypothetical protein